MNVYGWQAEIKRYIESVNEHSEIEYSFLDAPPRPDGGSGIMQVRVAWQEPWYEDWADDVLNPRFEYDLSARGYYRGTISDDLLYHMAEELKHKILTKFIEHSAEAAIGGIL